MEIFQFNIRWLYIIVGLTNVILGFLLLILKNSSSYIKGPLYWALGCFLLGSSLVYFSANPWPTEYLNILIANFFLVSSNSFYLTGIWKFKGKRVNYSLVFGLPLLALTLNTIFILTNHSGIRVGFNSAIFALYAFIAAYEMSFPPQKEFKSIFRVNATVFFIFGITMILRVMFSLKQVNVDIMESSVLNVSLLVFTTLLQGILTYGYIITVNIRIADDLKKQVSLRDKFLSIIGHDLKNQINIISGFSELLQSNIINKNQDKSLKFSGYIRQASLQINSLMSNLLEWAHVQSKIDFFLPEKVDLVELIKEEVDLNFCIAQNKQINIDFEETGSSIFVRADSNMIKTVIRNLLMNAIKFTKEGGSIKILIMRIEKKVEISIADSGIGIKPEALGKLFHYDSITTTEGTNKETGSGLGLILCKEFIEKHNERIWVESEFGQGSVFKFTLPHEA